MSKIGVGYASVTELEKKYVLDALDSQRLSQGKYVAKFQKEFSGMHGLKGEAIYYPHNFRVFSPSQ